MNPTQSPSLSPAPLALSEGDLVVGGVEACRVRLVAHLAETGGCLIDLGALTAFDAFGLQLLLAARQSAANAGRPFGLINPPAAFADTCALAGFSVDAFASLDRPLS